MEEREWGRGDRKDLQDLRIAVAQLVIQVKENARANNEAFGAVNVTLDEIKHRLFGNGNPGELATMRSDMRKAIENHENSSALVEDRMLEDIEALKSTRDKMLGVAGAITILSTVLATLAHFVIDAWLKR